MYPRIAYVTSAPDADLPLALAAFERARLDAQPVAWDADVAWDDFDLVLVRCAGDRRQDFLRWARAVEEETLLANPARILAKTSDRTYLRDLGRRGVPNVPTIWFEPGDVAAECEQALAATAWAGFVVTPNVGGATMRLDDAGAAALRAAELAGRGAVALIQPDLPDAQRLSVIVLGGQLSHAVVGGTGDLPDLADLLPELLRLASEDEDLLYGRFDLVFYEGQWLLAAFDATGAQLFLDADPQAADRLARAVRTRLSPPVLD